MSQQSDILLRSKWHFAISTTALAAIAFMAVGAVIGGSIGNYIAKKVQAASEDRWKYIVGGAVGGAVIGGTLGYLAGPAIATATGVGGISVTSAGISTVSAGTMGSAGFEQARQLVERTGSSQSTSSSTFTSNSYNVSALLKTQPDAATKITGINKYIEEIQTSGANSIDTIKVYVHEGQAYVIDGHHRFEAFKALGYTRVPIQYIHANQIKKYTDITLEEILKYAFR